MFSFTDHGIVSRLVDVIIVSCSWKILCNVFTGPVISEILFARLFFSMETELVNMWLGSLLLWHHRSASVKRSLACCRQHAVVRYCFVIPREFLSEQKIRKVGWKESVNSATVLLLVSSDNEAKKCNQRCRLMMLKGHVQVIVSEPHVLRQSQFIICGSRFLSDAKISPGDQLVYAEDVELLIDKQLNWVVDGNVPNNFEIYLLQRRVSRLPSKFSKENSCWKLPICFRLFHKTVEWNG